MKQDDPKSRGALGRSLLHRSTTAGGRRRTLSPTLRGQNDKVLDLQIWRLHLHIVSKILAEPALAMLVQQKLDERLSQQQIRHGEHLYWSAVLMQLADPAQFSAGVLTMEPRVCQYRRRTPFVGILTEQERQQALLSAQVPDEQCYQQQQTG